MDGTYTSGILRFWKNVQVPFFKFLQTTILKITTDFQTALAGATETNSQIQFQAPSQRTQG